MTIIIYHNNYTDGLHSWVTYVHGCGLTRKLCSIQKRQKSNPNIYIHVYNQQVYKDPTKCALHTIHPAITEWPPNSLSKTSHYLKKFKCDLYICLHMHLIHVSHLNLNHISMVPV